MLNEKEKFTYLAARYILCNLAGFQTVLFWVI